MALIDCLAKMPKDVTAPGALVEADRERIISASNEYKGRGMSEKDAEVRAVQDEIDYIEVQRSEVEVAVQEAFEKSPLFAKMQKDAETAAEERAKSTTRYDKEGKKVAKEKKPKAEKPKAEKPKAEKPVEPTIRTGETTAEAAEREWNARKPAGFPEFKDVPGQVRADFVKAGPAFWNQEDIVLSAKVEGNAPIRTSQDSESSTLADLAAQVGMTEKEVIAAYRSGHRAKLAGVWNRVAGIVQARDRETSEQEIKQSAEEYRNKTAAKSTTSLTSVRAKQEKSFFLGTGTTAERFRTEIARMFFTKIGFERVVGGVYDTQEQALAAHPEIAKKIKKGNVLRGWSDGKKVYFVVSNIEPGAELSVFLHEVGTHLGMEKLIGKDNMKRLSGQVVAWAQRTDNSLETRLAKRAMVRTVRAGAMSEEDTVQESIAYFVEEAVLAGVNPFAVNNQTVLARWFRSLWAAVKLAMRKIGVQRLDKLTAQNLVELAFGAARLEMAGTWHGTSSVFRNFNHDYMGSGEGAQAFGWGTYLAQRSGIAFEYWRKLTDRKNPNPFNTVRLLTNPNNRPASVQRLRSFLTKLAATPAALDKLIAASANSDALWKLSPGNLLGVLAGMKHDSNWETEAIREIGHYLQTKRLYGNEPTHDMAKSVINEMLTAKQEDIPGALMRVDTSVGDEEWLLLDELFSEQPERVQDSIKDSVNVLKRYAGYTFSRDVVHPETQQVIIREGASLGEETDEQLDLVKLLDELGIDEIYVTGPSDRTEQTVPIGKFKYAVNAIKSNKTGRNFYNNLAYDLFWQQPNRALTEKDEFGREGKLTREGINVAYERASHFLDAHGVMGNKFLDQPSRDVVPTVEYVGPKRDMIPGLIQMLERKSTRGDFEKARNKMLLSYQRRLNLTDDENAKRAIAKLEAAKAEHYKVVFPEQTYNLVVFNDRNVQRVMTQLGADKQRIRFSVDGGLPPYQAMRNSKIMHTVSNLARKGFLASAFTQDLADMAAKTLPSVVGYMKKLNERMVDRITMEARIDEIYADYDKLKEYKRTVDEFIYDSTFNGKWGYAIMPDKQHLVDPEMKKRFDALPANAQQLVRDVFNHGYEALREKQLTVLAAARHEFDPLIKAAKDKGDTKEVAALEKEKAKTLASFQKLLKLDPYKPYAPLTQFGDHIVVARSAKMLLAMSTGNEKDVEALKSSPSDYYVSFFPTRGQAVAEKARLEALGFPEVNAFEKDDTSKEAVWGGKDYLEAINRLRARLGLLSDEADKASVKLAQETLRSMYLHSLAEVSARKHEIARKYVAGTSKEMMRAFVKNGRQDAHFISAIKHNAELTSRMADMFNEAKEDYDKRMYYNEFMRRHARSLEYSPTPIQDMMTQTTGFWFLMTSPAYYLQNSTQPWLMSLPVMAGKYGFGKSFAALTAAYKSMAPIFKNWMPGQILDTEKLPEDVRNVVGELLSRGRIQIGMERELGEIVEGGRLPPRVNNVLRRVRGIMQNVETANRIATAVAAYRLSGSIEYADKIIYQTHGDYSGMNTPRVFNFPGSRVVMQFKKFQLIQASLLARLAWNAFKNSDAQERAIARKSLSWLLGHTAAAGGIMGLPFFTAIAKVLGWVFGDEDEPENPEKYWRDLLGNDTLADLLVKGAPAALGMDVSGKVGMGNILNPFGMNDVSLKDRKSAADAMVSVFGGPSANLGLRGIDGINALGRGDLYKGFELLLPTGVANAMKAARFATEGVSTKSGDIVMKPEEVSFGAAMGQAFGLPTTSLTEKGYRAKSMYDASEFYSRKTTELKQAYAKASRQRDYDEMQSLRHRWVAVQEARAKQGLKKQPMSELLRAPQEQLKRERSVVAGVKTTPQNRRMAEQLAGF